MKPTLKIILALGISIATTAAFADDASANQPQQPVTPQDFTWNAAVAGLKEVRLGEFAEQNSTNADVKKFARRMVRDHSAANKRLTKIAQAEGLNLPDTNAFYVTVTPPENEKSDAELMAQPQPPEARLQAEQLAAQHLESLSGAEFDSAYADAMVNDHTAAVQLFENGSASLTDKDLKKFAEKTLPKLREHYQMAQDLQNKLGGTQSTNTTGAYPNSPPTMGSGL
jgi:putative membrane protein